MPNSALTVREALADIFSHAVAQVRGDALIQQRCRLDGEVFSCSLPQREYHCTLPPREHGRIIVVGAGKAVAWLGKGMHQLLGERIADSCLIAKHRHALTELTLQQHEAGHPLPDAAGVAATSTLLQKLAHLSPQDLVFVLLTGGASSLLVAPVDGITLPDIIQVNDLLIRSGADIHAINTVRKQLSQVKGGGLLRHIAPARSVALLISDVPDNALDIIGSGPLYPDATGPEQALAVLERQGLVHEVPPAVLQHLRNASPTAARPAPPAHLILGDNQTMVDAACQRARELGLEPQVWDTHLHGDTHQRAREFCRALQAAAARRPHGKPLLLIGAGETTLQVRGRGKGGRNQEFALVAAQALAGDAHHAVLAAGSDGSDGPTDAAGGFADGSSVERAHAQGRSLRACLDDNDSYTLLQQLGDLHVSGPTGTNVMDLMLGLALAGPPAP